MLVKILIDVIIGGCTILVLAAIIARVRVSDMGSVDKIL